MDFTQSTTFFNPLLADVNIGKPVPKKTWFKFSKKIPTYLSGTYLTTLHHLAYEGNLFIFGFFWISF